MRGRAAALLVAAAILGGFLISRAVSGDGDRLADIGTGPAGLPEEEEAGALFPAGDTLYRQRLIGPPASAVGAYQTALAQAEEIHARTRAVAPDLARARWSAAGRTDVGGRVADLASDPTRPDTVYAATANAGLWRSTDAGVTWARSWPSVGPQTMGAIAVGPDGTLFAGTGLPHPAAGFVLWGGTGVFRSDDGGRSWQGAGLEGSGAVGRIVVDPADPDRLYVAAAGSPLEEGGERGLYRSSDGGESWEVSLAAGNGTTGAVDVAVDPSDPRRLLATMWDRDILSGRIAGPGSAVYLSTSGGDRWHRVRLPGNVPASRVGRIGVTFGPPGSHRAYAVVANDLAGQPVGLWRSEDDGSTWTKVSDLASELGGNGWWFGEVWADPSEPDRLFVAGPALLESIDGGETFSPHVGGRPEGRAVASDIHGLAWEALHPERVYLGGGLGIARSLSGGKAGTWVPAASQGWTLQYTVEERSLNPSALGVTLDPSTTPAAVAFDEGDPKVAYYGGRTVNRTEDGGKSWTAISPDLTTMPGADPDPFAVVTVVAPPPAGTRLMYAGTSNGLVWRTSNLGRTWDPVPPGPEQGWVTSIAIDPSNPSRAWVSVSGYADMPHVLATEDGGRSWRDASGNLPDAPVNDLLVLPGGGLAAATDLGVFVLARGAAGWLVLGSNLPTLPVLDMRVDGKEILVATFGNGFQRTRLPAV